jgi:hypothetical protein
LLVFQNIEAVTEESAEFNVISESASPGNTSNSFCLTLSGVRPVTYTQEHIVFAAIPPITGGKVTATIVNAARMITTRMTNVILKNFFMLLRINFLSYHVFGI